MSWNIKADLAKLTAGERGQTPPSPGGRIGVALVWPGEYRAGMSALGYLTVYSLLNNLPNVSAERFFAPDDRLSKEYAKSSSVLLSVDNARPLSDFELVAASLSLENDYWLLPRILAQGGLPPLKKDRGDQGPLVIVGGVAVWANPWPLMDYADLILTGEAEAQWPQLISAWNEIRFSSLPNPDRIEYLARKVPGALASGLVAAPPKPPIWGGLDLLPKQFYSPVKPAFLSWPPGQDVLPPVSPIVTPQAEFSNTKLVEISRGCPYGCRFCLAGFLFRPHRVWPMETILKALGEPCEDNEKVGLISPAAADHPQLPQLLDVLNDQKRIVTLSSLRLTAITPELAAQFSQGRLMGVAVAPEGGSDKIRAVINKNLSEAQILDGAKLLAEAGLKKIKLYFIMGLPGETDDDLRAIVDLCLKIRAVAKQGKALPELNVSLANFTPKPHTPFEEAAMDTEAEFKRKGGLVAAGLRKAPRLSVSFDPPKWSIVQGLLARGGPEAGALVAALDKHNGRTGAALKEIGYTQDHPIHRPWPENAAKPWRVVEPGSGFGIFEQEKKQAISGLLTSPCPPQNNCGRCLACGKR